uniref:30S ribosomal protein S18 n=1 Tax=Nephromyces sp. ex Molgula occidentalis TaxID=2544991 RepID=A0A5C1H7Y7_9APIC|nr:hypothetical protein [Nephromyces sp. ex Molgula occidentalis]
MSIFFNKHLLQTFFITTSNKIKSNKSNKKLSKNQYTYIRKLILYYRFLGLLSFSNKQLLNIL